MASISTYQPQYDNYSQESYSQESNNIMLGSTYNINSLSYDTYNINGDKILGFININDEVYNYNNFYAGDLVVSNGNTYTLFNSDINNYLVWGYSDDNSNGYVTNSEMEYDFNLKAFKKGQDTPIGSNLILVLFALIYIFILYKTKMRLFS